MAAARSRTLAARLALAAALLVAAAPACAPAPTGEQVLTFQPAAAALVNPLMGWAPWASDPGIQQPHTLVYADLTWRDFEPQPGVYDFDRFEQHNQLARWRSQHVRLVFRFVLDRPGPQPHRDIPDWLYDAIGGLGDTYDTSYGKGFSPDYSDPRLIEFHRRAILALGQRYAAEGLLAYIELGSLGHWGEWHIKTDSGLRPMPPKNIRDQYVRAYFQAFPATPLLMRRPFSTAQHLGLGLYNDLTGDPQATAQWLGWIASGGQYDQTGETGELVPMPDAWRTAPIGGEQSSAFTNLQLYGSGLQETVQLLRDSHASFVGPGSPADEPRGGPLQPGLDLALQNMGYRLYVQEARLPSQALLHDTLPVALQLANDGVAPMYYNWPAHLYLLDSDERVRVEQPLELDLRSALPGTYVTASASLPLQGLDSGTYEVAFGILDPQTGLPAVQLAVQDARRGLLQVLGTVEILRTRK